MTALLSACQPGPAESRADALKPALLSPEQLNQLILDRLSQSDFKEIDGARFYGRGAEEDGSRDYASKLSRDEVLGILSDLIEPHVVELRWADDYGQYHGGFRVKSDPRMVLGLSTSLVKMKTDTFKDAPEILKTYQSDVLYTPPSVWEEP
ncbi:hypothetical protein [Deinococcus multiflagellatus]|uniref:hypothetical protein n=1 Tax=Deinococcus multiflagellatus TaxID=1656887 RepID=UPI001CCCC470|nr:hypothetical protein [Deinococcus multiflagellatus]MBZ9715821.1 hypothetical protein [Deinococcus multiflagellatus]